MTNGQCLCGAVKFHGTLVADRGIGVCHCGQCRRWASGPFMAVRMQDGVTFDVADGLAWYTSSEHGERGFCNRCGSSLFWRRQGGGNDVAINVSALPDDHGQQIFEHIWVDDKPGFYDFADSAPRKTAAQAMGIED